MDGDGDAHVLKLNTLIRLAVSSLSACVFPPGSK